MGSVSICLISNLGTLILIFRDFHGRVHRPLAKQLAKALEPHRPLFIEEPLLPGQPQEIKDLYGMTGIPIAVCTVFFACHREFTTASYSLANVYLRGRTFARISNRDVLTLSSLISPMQVESAK